MNKDWWDGLPDDVRTALQAAADNTIGWSWKEAKSKSDEFLQKARHAGINVVELSDEQKSAAKQILGAHAGACVMRTRNSIPVLREPPSLPLRRKERRRGVPRRVCVYMLSC